MMEHFDYEYRVKYADTDKMGISYYGHYFTWFEAARTEYFRALGYPYTECERKSCYLPVVETRARYLSPSTYDDLLVIRTSVSEIGKSSLRFEYQVFKKNNSAPLAEGYSVHVFVNSKMKPVRMPAEIQKIIQPKKLLRERPSGKKNTPE